ncbi:MAG: VWA domain-containing protein [Pyrinomonadaceae bacterium]
MSRQTLSFKKYSAGLLRHMLVLLSFCAAQALAQEASKKAPPPDAGQDEEVVRVKSQLVNIDVVVKDKRGKFVTDLKAEDFNVVENGVPQKVLFFDPPLGGGTPAPAQPDATAREGSRTQGRQPRNIISLVLDGQTTDLANMKQAAAGAIKYIRERVTDADRVAVFSVSSGLQLLQPFTSDKERLVAAVERAYVSSNSAKNFEQRDISANISQLKEKIAGAEGLEAAAATPGPGQMMAGPALAEKMLAERMLQQYYVLRTTLSLQQSRPILAALAAICEGQRSVPGKKTLVLFSQGFVSPAVLDWQVRSTIDIANRANVAIYVIDSAGLRASAPASGALVPSAPLASVSGIVSQEERIRATGGENVFDRARFEGINREYDILYRISEDSGGKFIKNTNDIAKGLDRVDDEIRSRYTLGYQSTDANFDGSFRKIKLEVRRPDVEVVTRPGYYAIAPDEVVPLSPDDKKLLAGFAAAESNPQLPLSVELVPYRSGEGLYTVPVSIELPPAAVKFERKGDRQHMHLDFLGVVRDTPGKILSRLGGSFEVALTDEQYRAIVTNNIFYRQDMALAPGDYTVELVVRDRLSGKVAARREKLLVPETGAEFSASRVILSRYVEPVRSAGTTPGLEDVFRDGDVQIRPSPSREFSAADNLIIFFKLYNATPDTATGKPSVRVTVILSKDGKAVAKPLSYDLSEAAHATAVPHLAFAKFIPLAGLAPGRYEASVESRDMVTLKLVKQKAWFVIK